MSARAKIARARPLRLEPEIDGLELWCLEVGDPDRPRASRAPEAIRASRALLRELLAGRLGVSPDAIAFTRQPCPVCGAPRGRSVLSRPAGSELQFSTARGGGLALVALARTSVGVDVEPVADVATASEVATLLHPAEQRMLRQLPGPEQPPAFTRLWVRKEAYLKARGSGIAHGVAGEALNERAPAGWTLLDLPPLEGPLRDRHLAAVALSRGG